MLHKVYASIAQVQIPVKQFSNPSTNFLESLYQTSSHVFGQLIMLKGINSRNIVEVSS